MYGGIAKGANLFSQGGVGSPHHCRSGSQQISQGIDGNGIPAAEADQADAGNRQNKACKKAESWSFPFEKETFKEGCKKGAMEMITPTFDAKV